MAGFSWPGDLGIFKDIADKFFSDADESELRPIADEHKSLADQLADQLYDGDDAYKELEDAYEVDGKASDALSAVQGRRANYRQKAGALAAEAQAGQAFMQPVAQVISDSKGADAKAGYEAFKKAHETQYWPDWMLHTVGKETKVEEAKRQLEQAMSSNMNARVSKLQNTYKPPADGDYDFDGQPTSWDESTAITSADLQKSGNGDAVETIKSSDLQRAGGDRAAPDYGGFQRAGGDRAAPDYGGFQQAGAQNSAGASGGGSTGAVGQGGNGTAGLGAQNVSGGATGLQSAAGAVVEHAAPAAASQAVPQAAGGGVGAAPSIGGIGGVPAAGGAGQPARIGGVGGGSVGGGEGPRTGAQGAVAGEKPAAAQSSAGSEPRQGSGLSRGGGGGVGAAGGETRAMSAQQAALRDSLRTQDAAAGAGAHAQRVEAQQGVLGTGSRTQLAHATLATLTGSTESAANARAALPGRLAAREPWAAEVAGLAVLGGLVSAGRVWGMSERNEFGWVGSPVLTELGAQFEDPGTELVVFVCEHTTTGANEASGVARPTRVFVTSAAEGGALDPCLRLPEGLWLLDRDGAPAGTEAIGDPGRLARELASWIVKNGPNGDAQWQLAAVGFLSMPADGTVEALLALEPPVEAYWPGRQGYQGVSHGAQEAVVQSEGKLGAAKDAAQAEFDARSGAYGVPAGTEADKPYDGRGLTGKDLACFEQIQKDRGGRLPSAREFVEDRELFPRNDDGSPRLGF